MATLMLQSACFICLLVLTGVTWGHPNEPGVVRVSAAEGSAVLLPCSLSSRENVAQQLFDWRKPGPKEVFFYEAGDHYNNGKSGQDKQFKGRVSHFQEELLHGNASIMIHNTTIDDNGNYTCAFPLLNPAQMFNVELVVEQVLKDRSGKILGAMRNPCITICNVTDVGVQLRCEVHDASPQPELQWQDGDGTELAAEQPQVSERVGRFDVVRLATVTSTRTNRFRCVAKQERIGHAVETEITVSERLFEDKTRQVASGSCGWWMFIGGWFSGVLTLAAVLGLYVGVKYIRKRRQEGSGVQGNGSGVQANGSGVQANGSGVPGNGSGVQANGSGVQGTGSCPQGNGYSLVPLEPRSVC